MNIGTPRTSRIPAVLEFDSDDLPPRQATGSSLEEYKYDKLPNSHCIRLLELLPGEGTSRIECQITVKNLDDGAPLPFRAVSYTWVESKYDNLVIAGKKVTEFPGPRAKYAIQHPVWIDGCRLLISTNLRDALRRFRHQGKSLWFWIDALCINQKDLDERSNQVVLMPKIYHSAVSVWFWLGESDDASDITMAWLKALDNSLMQSMDEHQDSPPDIQLGMGRCEAESIVLFLQRPVFRRIWIVQELVTSRGIIAHCGPRSVSFRTLQHLLSSLCQQSLDVSLSQRFSPGENFFHCVNVIIKIQREWYLNRHNVRQRLVLGTRNFMATEPKDKVFALMGMFNDFSHRDSCHLGVCDESHPNPDNVTSPLDKFKNLTINRDCQSDFGLFSKVLSTAVRELITHEREVQRMMVEKAGADLLRRSTHALASDVYQSLKEYLTFSLHDFTEVARRAVKDNLIEEFLDEKGDDEEDDDEWRADKQNPDDEAGGSSTRVGNVKEKTDDDEGGIEEGHDSGEDKNYEDGVNENNSDENSDKQDYQNQVVRDTDKVHEMRILQQLINFLELDLDGSDLEIAQMFISLTLKNITTDWQMIQESSSHQDTWHLLRHALTTAVKQVRWLLKLIKPDSAPNSSPERHDSSSFCDFDFLHGSLFAYQPGQISFAHFAGRYILACSSSDNDVFESALKALCQSESPPRGQCTLKESSWRLLKAVFGDMSQWNQEDIGNGIISTGEIQVREDDVIFGEVPDLTKFVDLKWLAVPLSEYLDVSVCFLDLNY